MGGQESGPCLSPGDDARSCAAGQGCSCCSHVTVSSRGIQAGRQPAAVTRILVIRVIDNVCAGLVARGRRKHCDTDASC